MIKLAVLDYDLYLNRMANDGTWAGQPEIKAVMDMFGRSVIVVSSVNYSCVMPEAVSADPIFILYDGRVHYDALQHKPGVSCDTAMAWAAVHQYQASGSHPMLGSLP